MLEIDHQDRVELDTIRRYAFLTMEHVKEPDTGDGYRHAQLRSGKVQRKNPVKLQSPIEHRPHRIDVIEKLTARRTLRVGGFNDHGYARIDWIGNDKVIVLVR